MEVIKIIGFVIILLVVIYYAYKRLNVYGSLTSEDILFINKIKEEAKLLKDPEERDIMFVIISLAVTKLDLDILCTETVFLLDDIIQSQECVSLAQKIADYPFGSKIAQ